jgi:DNA polymerase
MSQYNEALDYLHDSLLQLREQGKENLTASKQALADLLGARAVIGGPGTSNRSVGSVGSVPSPRPTTPPPAGKASASKAEQMAALRATALVCRKCPHLAASRTQVVFGIGNLDAEIMFVGEAPGADEDVQGEPFVGKAGQLLTKIISAMGFQREQVYIDNVVKCRPDVVHGDSENRKPTTDEMATCQPYLIEQIRIIQPKVLVALGATAMKGLTGAKEPISQLRGHWHEFEQIPLMATFHPSYLLHNQANSEKRKVWEDMLLVLEKLGKPVSEKQRKFFK